MINQIPSTSSSLDDQMAIRMAELFNSMGDPTRVKIISILMDGQINVGDLVSRLGLSQSAVSHQLTILRTRRVIKTMKHGRQVFVSLDDDHIRDLFQRSLDHLVHE